MEFDTSYEKLSLREAAYGIANAAVESACFMIKFNVAQRLGRLVDSLVVSGNEDQLQAIDKLVRPPEAQHQWRGPLLPGTPASYRAARGLDF